MFSLKIHIIFPPFLRNGPGSSDPIQKWKVKKVGPEPTPIIVERIFLARENLEG
jgi:hypothetical protein